MSLTSCFRFILELPVATLNKLVRGAFAESDGRDLPISGTWEDVPVDGRTATISVRPADLATLPPTLALTATDLGLVLHLHMRVEVDVDDLPLDAIVYAIEFDLPGAFAKSATAPPELLMGFPAVTEAGLNLNVSGGTIPLSAELIEPRIHAAYDADPSFGHSVRTGVAWPLPADPTVVVTVDIFDDEPGSPGFRGAITAEVSDPTHVILHMPGHFRIQGLSNPNYVNTDMTLDIVIEVIVDAVLGEARVKLGAVQPAHVTVTFATSSLYDLAARPILAGEVAAKLVAMGDQVEAIPTTAEVRTAIVSRLLALAPEIQVPVFTPQPPGADEIDLTTFVPTTVSGQVLALQLAQLTDGTPCDTPDVVADAADGFAISVAASEVDTMMQPVLAGQVGDHEIGGYTVTLHNVSGALSDPGAHGVAAGHIWIEGDTTVHVDCWADPDIAFWGPITLIPLMAADGKLAFQADAGDFGADDPCCADVDPAQIAALIEGEQSAPIGLPRNFAGVGELQLGVDRADIFAAGVVVHGTFDVLTNLSLHASALRETLYWFNEQAGGG